MTTIEYATIKRYGDIINGLFNIEYHIYDPDKAEESAQYLQYTCPECTVSKNECYNTHLSGTQKVLRELGCMQYMCPNGYSFIVVEFYVRSVPIGCMILGPMQVAYNDTPISQSVPVLRSKQFNSLQNIMREMVALYNAGSYSTSTDLSVDVLPDIKFRPLINGYSQYNMALETQLLQMFNNGFSDQTTHIISQIVDNLFDVTGQDASEVRKRTEELAYIIAHAAISQGTSKPESFQEANKYHNEVKKMKYKEDFIAFLSDVVDFYSDLQQSAPSSDSRSNIITRTAHEYISQHYAEKITLDQTAAYCQISPSHLGTVLVNKLGYTFTQYVNFIRIEKSKELLIRTNDSIGCIAEKCGFTGQSYFTQVFKSFVGKSPIDYRRDERRRMKQTQPLKEN